MFKKLFSNLANDLVQKLPTAPNKFDNKSVDYYNDMFNFYPKKLTFQAIQTKCISGLLKNCHSNKAAGTDNLSGRFLKDGADILTIPITQLCNLSIKFSHFPKDCKVAKLKPLYKKGSKTDPKHFRLISLLSIVKEIERNLNKNFSNVCDWFVDNKLSIHFEEDKTKCILFGTKHRLNKVNSLGIKYGEIHIKQYYTVTYLGCLLDETLSGEAMALKVINKINSRVRFLYRKNRFLSPPLRRLLCNSLIQPILIMLAQLDTPT